MALPCTCNLSVHKTQYNPWLRWFQTDFWTNIFLSELVYRCWFARKYLEITKVFYSWLAEEFWIVRRQIFVPKPHQDTRLQWIYWGLFQRFKLGLGTLQKLMRFYRNCIQPSRTFLEYLFLILSGPVMFYFSDCLQIRTLLRNESFN